MSEQNIQGKFCVFLVTHSPFDIFILHDVTEEIYIVGHTYRCHDPENGVSVNAREWFSIFFLLTWKVIEKKESVNSCVIVPWRLWRRWDWSKDYNTLGISHIRESVLPPIRCRLVRHLAKQWNLSTHCTRMVMNLLPNMISFALPGGLNPQLSCFRSFGGESDNFLWDNLTSQLLDT